jgi:hypothetical protein
MESRDPPSPTGRGRTDLNLKEAANGAPAKRRRPSIIRFRMGACQIQTEYGGGFKFPNNESEFGKELESSGMTSRFRIEGPITWEEWSAVADRPPSGGV